LRSSVLRYRLNLGTYRRRMRQRAAYCVSDASHAASKMALAATNAQAM
jgi:hypothetical protein